MDKEPKYFSYWSYSTYSKCPLRYKLQCLDRVAVEKEAMDHGYITQGSVPHDLAETFFHLPIDQRELGFFLDNFETYFNTFVAAHHIDLVKHGSINKVKELTLHAVKNQVKLIQQLNLLRAVADPEESFKIQVAPDLKFGGRVDLIVHADEANKIIDIYDWKATSNTDPQQMLFYIAASIKRGFKVRNVAFLLLKEGRPRKVKFDQIILNRLFSAVRHAGQLIDKGHFPPQFSYRACEYCDVGSKCEICKAMLGNKGKLIPPGKISF